MENSRFVSDDEIFRTQNPVAFLTEEKDAGTKSDLHHHTWHQLIYASKGVMFVETSSGQWIVPTNRGVWVPSMMTHAVEAKTFVKSHSLYIKPDYPCNLPTKCTVIHITPLTKELMIKASSFPQNYVWEGQAGKLIQVLINELVVLPAEPLHLPFPNHPKLKEFVQKMQQEPDNVQSLEEWSKELNMTSKTFSRLFLKETGMNFNMWRHQFKILKALEWLAQGQSVTTISLNLGYSSLSSFIEMFKKYCSKTPSHYFEKV
jgi:AraC-like DNA-binding protein